MRASGLVLARLKRPRGGSQVQRAAVEGEPNRRRWGGAPEPCHTRRHGQSGDTSRIRGGLCRSGASASCSPCRPVRYGRPCCELTVKGLARNALQFGWPRGEEETCRHGLQKGLHYDDACEKVTPVVSGVAVRRLRPHRLTILGQPGKGRLTQSG